MTEYFDIDEKEDEMEDTRAKPKKKSVNEWLEWVSEHKFFTIVIMVLLILGFGRIAKHFSKIEKHLA